jgi:hypothetical protein
MMVLQKSPMISHYPVQVGPVRDLMSVEKGMYKKEVPYGTKCFVEKCAHPVPKRTGIKYTDGVQQHRVPKETATTNFNQTPDLIWQTVLGRHQDDYSNLDTFLSTDVIL